MIKHEMIKASALKRREYLNEADKSILKVLEKNVEHLAEKVNASTKTNIELQEKITELMVHLTDLIENIQKMSNMIDSSNSSLGKLELPEDENYSEEFPSNEEDMTEIENSPNKNVSSQLKELALQNKELTRALKNLESQLKKGAVRDAIKKALEKVKK